MRKCHRTCILHHNSQFKSWIPIFYHIKALEKWHAVFHKRWPAFLLKLYANNSQNQKWLLPCGMLATRTHTRNCFTALFLGQPRWAGARREILDFMVQGKIKINRGRHADHPAGRHSIRTKQCPPPSSRFYRPDALPSAQPTVSKRWRQLVHSD